MMTKMTLSIIATVILLSMSCQSDVEPMTSTPIGTTDTSDTDTTTITSPMDTDTEDDNMDKTAQITAVQITGTPGSYSFNVTIASPDTGCDQYADWWEVITVEGELIYRRVLLHSHVTEQPFTRSGGTVDVQPTDEIIVRAHMNNIGYGTQVFRGTLENNLEQATLDSSFAIELAQQEPLPTDCAF